MRTYIILAISAIIMSVVFTIFPEIDLWISALFYDDGVGFIYRHHPVTKFFYYLIYILSATIGGGLLILLAAKYIHNRTSLLKKIKRLPSYSAIVFLFVALILGPGLLVHQVIKSNWGRARPVNIVEFGGKKQFTPALIISDQGGNSFISGHASMGFYMTAFALLFTGRRKKILYTTFFSFGVIVALCRVLQGAHFLSDVMFAAITIITLNHVLHRCIMRSASKKS